MTILPSYSYIISHPHSARSRSLSLSLLFSMDSIKPEVADEIFPYLRVYKDGTVERLAGTEFAPAGLDPQTGVSSKDIVIVPETGVSVRIYRPNSIPDNRKLPIVVYFHGGAFIIASIGDPKYHDSLNLIVAEGNVVLVSVDYRLAPEHPLPAAYEDCWSAIQWVDSHFVGDDSNGNGNITHDSWIKDYGDFGKVFLAGDSAGANIAHHLTIRLADSDLAGKLKVTGILLVNPYFWGEKPIGLEVEDHFRKGMVDNWWRFVCPSGKGNDDPLMNPFVLGDEIFERLACSKIIVTIAEKDILRDRGILYYETLVKSQWQGIAQIVEIEGEDHVFHIFDPDSEKAKRLVKSLASFINQIENHNVHQSTSGSSQG